MSVQLLVPFGSTTSEALRWAAFLLTYGLHAFTWAAVAALLVRYTAPSSTRASGLWRLALFGPIATALASIALPVGRSWSWTSARAHAPGLVSAAPFASTDATAAWHSAGSWTASLLATLLIGTCAAGLLRFVVSAARFAAMLRTRTPVQDAQLLLRFARVVQRTQLTGVRLTESCQITVPMVLGRREVCICKHGLAAFTDAELEAIFAHEIAHLERNDGLWFPAIGLIEAALWVQPLNRWVAAQCRQAAELACDDRAVELTLAPMDLARAITRMAEHAQRRPVRPLVPAMSSVSPPLQRVRRLVGVCSLQTARRRAPWWPLACLVVLGLASPRLGVEIAEARTPNARTPTAQPARRAVAETMDELDLREQRLQRELDLLMSHATLGAQNPLTVTELRCTLREVRALRALRAQSEAQPPKTAASRVP